MFRFRLELHRLWSQRRMLLAVFMLGLLIIWLSNQLLSDARMVLVCLPVLAYIFSDFYLHYLNKAWLSIIDDSEFFYHHILIAVCLISVMLNALAATFLSLFYDIKLLQVIVLWGLLDIMGVFIYAVRMSAQLSSKTVSYLMFVPIVYPLVMMGEMALGGHSASIQFIIGLWLFAAASSPFMVAFVSKI